MIEHKLLFNKVTWCDLLCLTGIIAIAYCCYGIPPLFPPDEGRYATIASEMLAHHQYLIPHVNDVIYFEKPPLIYWLTAFFLKLFGHNLWAVRFVNPFLSWISVWFTYLCCRIIYNRRVAFLGALFSGTMLLGLAMGHMLTLDCGVAVFLNISLLSFLVGLQYDPGFKRSLWLWLAYLAAGAAVMTKGLIGIVFPMMIIGLWVLIRNQWWQVKHFRIITGLILVLLIALPWPLLVQHKYSFFLYYYFIRQEFLRYATPLAGREMNIFSYIGVFVLGLFPWVFFLPQALKRFFKKEAVAITADDALAKNNDWFLLIWGGAITLFFAFSNSILIPYITPILVPFAILIARYVDTIFVNNLKKSDAISISFYLFFCAVFCIAFIVIPFVYHVDFAHIACITFPCAIGLLACFIVGFYALLRKHLLWFLSSMIIMMIILTKGLWLAGPYVNQRTIIPLAHMIQPVLRKHPDTRVVNYHTYDQDLPFYLRRKMIVVSWRGELNYGYQHQPEAKEWMITTSKFWHLWDTKPMFVVLSNANYVNKTFQHKAGKVYFWGKTTKKTLISNFPKTAS